jgi:hypothetical protein
MDKIFFDGTGDKKAGKFKIESEIPLEAGQHRHQLVYTVF